MALLAVVLVSMCHAQKDSPPAPSRPQCHIPFNGNDLHCSWEPGSMPWIPSSYTLHWKPDERDSEGHVAGGNVSGVIPRSRFNSHVDLLVWVTATSHHGLSSQSPTVKFNTGYIWQPLSPVVSNHSVQPGNIEIFWDFDCPDQELTDEWDIRCRVQYRAQEESDWTEINETAQKSFELENPQPFVTYEFRTSCACGGDGAVMSGWSGVYRAMSAEEAPEGPLDVWSHCGVSSIESECSLVWKELPRSLARGQIIGYVLTVELSAGTVRVTNLTRTEVGVRSRHCRLPLSLQGVTAVCLAAYNSKGVTDPTHLALPSSAGPMAVNHDHLENSGIPITVETDGKNLNVSWVGRPELPESILEYVVQQEEAGLSNETRGFDWIKVNSTQQSVLLTGDFRNYTPYSLSLFSLSSRRRRMLGFTIAYTVQGVPPKLTEVSVTQISPSEVNLTWLHIPLIKRRGIILGYQLGFSNDTVYSVSKDVNSFLLSGLQPGRHYRVWISAQTGAGLGPRREVHFFTMDGMDYLSVMLVIMGTLMTGILGLLCYCGCSRWKAPWSLMPGWCYEKVPDPNNSRVFQPAQQHHNVTWPEFSFPEPNQKISQLEVMDIQGLADKPSPRERSHPPGQSMSQIKARQTQDEGVKEGERLAEGWPETMGKGETELSCGLEGYSLMTDRGEGEGAGEPGSPRPTQQRFSDYEKHFMPTTWEGEGAGEPGSPRPTQQRFSDYEKHFMPTTWEGEGAGEQGSPRPTQQRFSDYEKHFMPTTWEGEGAGEQGSPRPTQQRFSDYEKHFMPTTWEGEGAGEQGSPRPTQQQFSDYEKHFMPADL